MARSRTWYKKYIGYMFSDGGILQDVFYYEENGKRTGTGYEMYYPDKNTTCIMDYATFKQIADATDLPKVR